MEALLPYQLYLWHCLPMSKEELRVKREQILDIGKGEQRLNRGLCTGSVDRRIFLLSGNRSAVCKVTGLAG